MAYDESHSAGDLQSKGTKMMDGRMGKHDVTHIVRRAELMARQIRGRSCSIIEGPSSRPHGFRREHAYVHDSILRKAMVTGEDARKSSSL